LQLASQIVTNPHVIFEIIAHLAANPTKKPLNCTTDDEKNADYVNYNIK